MDLMIRNWMIIIGFCLIMVVLLDALRRVFKDRREEVRLNAKISRRDVENLDDDDSFNLLTELPNGGARIVSRDDLQPVSDGEGDGGEISSLEEPPSSSSASFSEPPVPADTEASAVLLPQQPSDPGPSPEPALTAEPASISEPELPSASAWTAIAVRARSPLCDAGATSLPQRRGAVAGRVARAPTARFSRHFRSVAPSTTLPRPSLPPCFATLP